MTRRSCKVAWHNSDLLLLLVYEVVPSSQPWRWIICLLSNGLVGLIVTYISDTRLRHKSGSTLVLVLVCCPAAPNHEMNHYWLIIKGVLWHSPNNNFTSDTLERNQVEAQHQMGKVSQIWQTIQIGWYRMLTPWHGVCVHLVRHRVPLVDTAVLSTCGITRSGRSAKSGRPSTSGVELRPGNPWYVFRDYMDKISPTSPTISTRGTKVVNCVVRASHPDHWAIRAEQ